MKKHETHHKIVIKHDVEFDNYNHYVDAVCNKITLFIKEQNEDLKSMEQLSELQFVAYTDLSKRVFTIKFE